MRWIFIIPDPEAFPSGGNVYNQKIIQALKELGENVEIIQPEHLDKIIPTNQIYVWDTIYLSEMANLDIPRMSENNIMLIHHLASMYPGPKSVFDQMERAIIDQMDALWVTSEYSKQYLLGHQIDLPIFVMPPIFNGPKFNFRSPSQVPRLLIAANLVQRKGVYDFLKSLAQNSLPPYELNITGSHNLEPDYAKQCIQLVDSTPRLKSINFLGPIPQKDVFELYHRSDLYLSTSYFETFGMSIQEALYYKTPVLGIDGGNTRYLIEGSGWCVQTMEELVMQLLHLLDQKERIEQQEVIFENWKPDWIAAAQYLIQAVKT